MRKDIDPASYGRVAVSELPGSPVQGEDVILIAKRYMADPEPYKIVTVVSADQAAILRRSLQQPQTCRERCVPRQVPVFNRE